ncbi:MAG: DNA-methyltransferase, partial [Methylocystis sp.]
EPGEVDALRADLLDPEHDAADDIDSDALKGSPASRSGDRWLLGEHRLLCGDARSVDDLDRLMDGQRAAAMFTDPPYNVAIRGVVGRGGTKHREFAMASGELSEAAFVQFLREALGQAIRVSKDGAVHYVFMDWRHIDILMGVGRELYSSPLNMVVWNKTTPGQGSFYRSQHELIGVFRVGEASHQNNIELGRHGRNRSNVWTYPGVNSFGAGRDEALAMHPTVKPVALIADALRDCTRRGDLILDPFAGSGSTILAAERVGRRAYALEIDPRYVDVAVRRWQAYTRRDAVCASTGLTFDDTQARRAATPKPSTKPTTTSPNENAAGEPSFIDLIGD